MMLQLNEIIREGNEAYFNAHQAGHEPRSDISDYPEQYGCTIDQEGRHTLQELATAAVFAGLFESPHGSELLSRGQRVKSIRNEWASHQSQNSVPDEIVKHHPQMVAPSSGGTEGQEYF